jgi:hypothetical protein
MTAKVMLREHALVVVDLLLRIDLAFSRMMFRLACNGGIAMKSNDLRIRKMDPGKMMRLIVVAVIMIGLTSAVRAANPIPRSERDALLALYSSTNGASWINNSGWGGAIGTECSWSGIDCILEGDQGTGTYHIYQIRLDNNNLSGPIPEQLINLKNLLYLHLEDNQLTGSIPPEIGNMTHLQYLGLSYNQLTGSIPPEIGNLKNLKALYLNHNHFSGDVPIELTYLVDLSNSGGLNLRYNCGLKTNNPTVEAFLNQRHNSEEPSWSNSQDSCIHRDIDGDGKTDISLWRPNSGVWYTLLSNSPGN